MKTIKTTFGLTVVLYLCTALGGAPFLLSASAKITPKNVTEATALYEVKGGDTLWNLAKRYRQNPSLWSEFHRYNLFTNPNLIYPNEKLQVLKDWGLTEDASNEQLSGLSNSVVPDPILEQVETTQSDIEGVKTDLKEVNERWDSAMQVVENLKNEISALSKHNQRLQDALDSNTNTVTEIHSSLISETEASRRAISEISSHIKVLQGELNQRASALRDQQVANLDMIDARAKSFVGQFEKRGERISDIRAEIGKLDSDIKDLKDGIGEWEEPSKSKRRFAILATVAGGVALFAVNALGSSD
jgi:LysM repeat protein